MAIKNRSKGSVVAIIIATVLSFPTAAAPLYSNDSPAPPWLNANHDPLTNNEWRIYDVNGDGNF